MSIDHNPDVTVESEYLQLVRYTPIMQAKKTTDIMALRLCSWFKGMFEGQVEEQNIYSPLISISNKLNYHTDNSDFSIL